MATYGKFSPVPLKSHPELSEMWVQERIAEDPSILGLGDLILKDKERLQPRAGRLDLLLQDVDSGRRYEVEVQLGPTDESHIIRTIEYWDIERKRYPQYDHVAVLVAEDITSRFLNVINLFNGSIPLIAIQMRALSHGDTVGLVFTTVVDELRLGLVDDDEEVAELTDRAYWETRGTKQTVSMVDQLLAMARDIDDSLELKYNKLYIGTARSGITSNFVVFRPQKRWLRFEPRIPRSAEQEEQLTQEGLDLLDYDTRWKRYRIRLEGNDITAHDETIRGLIRQAYELEGR